MTERAAGWLSRRGQRDSDRPADAADASHELLLHIGGPKCGSSAIQTALLTHHERLAAAGVHPAVLDSTAQLQVGAAAAATGWKHQAQGMRLHPDLGSLIRTERLAVPQLRGMLRRAVDVHGRVVVSDEGLANLPLARRLIDAGVLEGIPTRVVLYVRPQVDVLNSAWWQWGAWGGDDSVEQWLDAALELHWLRWDVVSLRWAEAVGAERLSTRLLPGDGQDVVDDFLAWLGLAPLSHGSRDRVNRRLPRAVVEHYVRQPHLRPGPHSADIDFVIGRSAGALPADVARAPDVLDAAQRAAVVERFEANNRRLLERWLVPEHRDRMREDHRWWTADPGGPQAWRKPSQPSTQDLDLLVSLLWSTVLDQDRRIRRLEAGGR